MFVLRKTCGQAPELYDVITSDGQLVGEVRTRWGATTVTCYVGDEDAVEIFGTADHRGTHSIPPEDFDYVIRRCLGAVRDWIDAGRPTERIRPLAPVVPYEVEDREQDARMGRLEQRQVV